jgi:hypothetical protein
MLANELAIHAIFISLKILIFFYIFTFIEVKFHYKVDEVKIN